MPWWAAQKVEVLSQVRFRAEGLGDSSTAVLDLSAPSLGDGEHFFGAAGAYGEYRTSRVDGNFGLAALQRVPAVAGDVPDEPETELGTQIVIMLAVMDKDRDTKRDRAWMITEIGIVFAVAGKEANTELLWCYADTHRSRQIRDHRTSSESSCLALVSEPAVAMHMTASVRLSVCLVSERSLAITLRCRAVFSKQTHTGVLQMEMF